jgi:hypothetical protein
LRTYWFSRLIGLGAGMIFDDEMLYVAGWDHARAESSSYRLSGHTPGSVIIFVTLYNGTRYVLVGDLVWQLEGITLREERPWFMRQFAVSDAAGVRENLLRMIAVKKRLPELIIIPAHDMRAFAELPTLSSASNEAGRQNCESQRTRRKRERRVGDFSQLFDRLVDAVLSRKMLGTPARLPVSGDCGLASAQSRIAIAAGARLLRFLNTPIDGPH